MIGQNIPRIDGYEKVTGKAVYTTDLFRRFPDMLHIKALRSPYAHARIKRLDHAQASALPGVVGIATGEEPGIKWGVFPPQSKMAKGEAIWAGQAVALVAAETPAQAEAAVSAIRVEYEPLPHVLTWQDAFRSDPVSIVDPITKVEVSSEMSEFDLSNVAGTYYLNTGEVDPAFAQADVIVEGEFWTGKKTHNQLERAAALVEYGSDGAITLYCNGCGVHAVIKKSICDAFGLPENRVRIVQPYTGGSFGNRNVPYIEMQAMLMALKTRRTVYFEFTRREMFTAAPSNWTCATKIRLAARHDGTLLAKDVRLIEEIGAATGKTPYTGRTSSSSLSAVYGVPNVRMCTGAVRTNTVPAGSYRGLGAPDASFAFESLMDELAERLRMSPLELRLKNLLKVGEADDYGEVCTSIGLEGCLRAVAEAIALDEPCTQDDPVWRRGKGIACAAKQNGPRSRSEAEVLYYSDCSAEVRVSCDNQGMGATTSILQIAARELALPLERIRVTVSDTAITPFDNNSSSSTGVYRTGNAVRLACIDVVRQIAEAAARVVGVCTDMVKVEGDKVSIVGAHVRELHVAKLFQPSSPFRQDIWGLKKGTPIRGTGVFCPAPIVQWDRNGRTPRMWNWFQYGATGVEIAVNVQTGQIKVLRFANAGDTGNPISPKIVEGQLEGAAHMAIGFCLAEEHLYDENGAIVNATLSDYRLPMIFEMPKCRNAISIICPDPLPDGPYGAKGMSESVVSAMGPAIAAALYQATGVRMRTYPMTAERVLDALRRRGAGSQ